MKYMGGGGGGKTFFIFTLHSMEDVLVTILTKINSLKIPQPIIMAFFTGQLLLLNTVQGSV